MRCRAARARRQLPRPCARGDAHAVVGNLFSSPAGGGGVQDLQRVGASARVARAAKKRRLRGRAPDARCPRSSPPPSAASRLAAAATRAADSRLAGVAAAAPSGLPSRGTQRNRHAPSNTSTRRVTRSTFSTLCAAAHAAMSGSRDAQQGGSAYTPSPRRRAPPASAGRPAAAAAPARACSRRLRAGAAAVSARARKLAPQRMHACDASAHHHVAHAQSDTHARRQAAAACCRRQLCPKKKVLRTSRNAR